MAEMEQDIKITVDVDTSNLDAAIEKAKLLIELLDRAERADNPQEEDEKVISWDYGKIGLIELVKIVENLERRVKACEESIAKNSVTAEKAHEHLVNALRRKGICGR